MKFPTFEGVNSTYKSDADNADLRKAIVQAVPKATQQMKDFSAQFSGANDQQTCKKIFDFLKNQIQYKADGANQIVRFPSALLKTKTGDCKSYSLLTAAILNNLKIPCKFVLQSFNDNPTPSHIYVETMSGVKCDAVWGKFNSEKPSTYRYTIPMNVKYMAGTGGDCGCSSCKPAIGSVGIGLTQQNREACNKKYPTRRLWKNGPDINAVSRNACYAAKEVEEKAQQAKDYVAKLNLKKYFGSLPRQIQLGMYSTNIDGMATNLNNSSSKNQVLMEWVRLGGDKKALERAIRDGSSKKPIKVGFKSAIEKKIKELLNKHKGIKGASDNIDDNAFYRKEAKKLLMEPGTVSDAYMSTLLALGAKFGATIGGIVGSVVPGAGNVADAATGTTAGSGIGYLAFKQTPAIIDAIFPVDGTTGGDPNMGDPSYGGGVVTPPVGDGSVSFDYLNDGALTLPSGGEKDDDTKKAGFGGIILPALIGVGVIMALNAGKKSK